jgi:hypothetical protein
MRSVRLAIVGVAAVVALGFVGLAVAAITTTSSQEQTLGVGPFFPIAALHPRGGVVCEEPIAVAKPITNIRFNAGTRGRPGTPLDVTVSRWGNGGGVLAAGHVPGGWVDNGTPRQVHVKEVAAGQNVSICIRNRGLVPAYVFGDLGSGGVGTKLGADPRPTITPAQASVDGKSISGDISMSFVGVKARSLLSRLPDVFERASLFRPRFVEPWMLWLLFAAILIAAPLVLVRALAGAAGASRDEQPGESTDTGPADPPSEASPDIDVAAGATR